MRPTRSGPGRAARAALLAAALAAAPLRAQAPLDALVPPSPAPASFIHDGGPVLDAAARARLDARIATVQRETGGDVGVAILRDLRDRAPSDVGVAIYRAWRVGAVDSLGSARRDLGALLLLVPKELAPSGRGECWITTGRGAEAGLIDADAGTICREAVIPRLREQDYEGAVAAGVDGIGAFFRQATAGQGGGGAEDGTRPARPRVDVPPRRGRGDPLPWLVGGGAGLIGLVGAAVGALLWRRRRPRPCPRGHGMMARLDEAADDAALSPGQRTEERIGSVDYDVWACPACPERLVVPYRRWSGHEACPRCGHRTVEKDSHTLQAATMASTGLEEITLHCHHCRWRDVTRRVLPQLPPPSAGGSGSSVGGGGGGRGGSSFGGSGRTGGGGGGGSY